MTLRGNHRHRCFARADARQDRRRSRNMAIIPSVDFDFGLRHGGGHSGVKTTSNYDFRTSKLSAVLTLELMAVGRNFILRSEGSEQKPSDEQSESTAEPTTAASPILKKRVIDFIRVCRGLEEERDGGPEAQK